MGLFTSLFGGTSLERIPGTQPYIDKLGNFDPLAYGLKLGLGQAGKGAKQDYKDIRSGKDISKIAGFSGTLGAINSAYDSGDRARSREYQSDVALMNQPMLASAQSAELQRKSNQDRSSTIAQAAGGFYDRTQGILNDAFQASQARRLAASGQKLQADQAALQGQLGSYYQKQNTGLFNALGNFAGGAGSAATGVSGLFKGGK